MDEPDEAVSRLGISPRVGHERVQEWTAAASKEPCLEFRM